MVFLDKLLDVWSNRRSIEAHHEQLTLRHISLADQLRHIVGGDPPSLYIAVTSATRTVTLRIVFIAAAVCLPVEIIPYGIYLLRLRHDDYSVCLGSSTRTCDGSESFNVTCGGLLEGWRRGGFFATVASELGTGDATLV